MDKIIAYAAVLDNSENQNDVYTVTFPDVPSAISQGNTLAEAIENGSEALGLALYEEKELPKHSNYHDIMQNNEDKVVTLIASDLDKIAATVKKPTVKKNTTIPGDLAQKAEDAGINFSQTLAEALREKLGV